MEIGIVQVVAVIGSVASVLCTVVVGSLTFFLKRTLTGLEEADRKNAAEIERVKNDLNDLKSDLPLVYTLREDFIRVINNVEDTIGKLDRKLDKIEEKLDGIFLKMKE